MATDLSPHTTTFFDQEKYWLERHEKFRGDPRSVGCMARTPEECRRGERHLQRTLPKVLAAVGGQTALDLGCGIGRYTSAFISCNFRYLGVDVSPVAIAQAMAKYPQGPRFVVANLKTWTSQEVFDVVCAAYVLVHFVDDDDWRSALETALSCVSPSGSFLFADELASEPTRRSPHVMVRSKADYVRVLSKHGFAFDDRFKALHLDPLGLNEFYLIRRINNPTATASS